MARIEKLRQGLEKKGLAAILLANPADIYYYSGFLGEDSWLLISQDEVFLLTDGRYTEQAAEECPDVSVLCQGGQNGSWVELLAKTCQSKGIYSLAFDGGFFNYREYMAMQQALAKEQNIKLADSWDLASYNRRVKDQQEIDKLKEIARIGDEVLQAVTPYFQVGVSEKELARKIDDAFLAFGADGLSFPTIVAAGKNGAKPHAKPSDYRFYQGDFVTMDFGGRLQGYCGDMTRTIAIGQPDRKQKEVYQIVLQAQEQAVDFLKPGVTSSEADQLARAIITEAGYGPYFSHSLGHGVGIEIHEEPTLRPGSNDILEVGHIVTVEPGVYIPDWGGIRIEDTVVITANGAERLTLSCKELRVY